MLQTSSTSPTHLTDAELERLHREGSAAERLHRTRSGTYIRDVVYSANDGLVTTFAVVAGVAGAALSSRVVMVLGLANMIADGFSMALGNYLGTKSRVEYERRSRELEEWEVARVPERERDEIREIAGRRGIPAPRVAAWVEAVTADKKPWVDEMLIWELGIIPGETANPTKNGLATFFSFVIAGFLPLVPFVFQTSGNRFLSSALVTASALFGIGALRTLVTNRHWLRSGVEMLAVGGMASMAAYLVGILVGRIA